MIIINFIDCFVQYVLKGIKILSADWEEDIPIELFDDEAKDEEQCYR